MQEMKNDAKKMKKSTQMWMVNGYETIFYHFNFVLVLFRNQILKWWALKVNICNKIVFVNDEPFKSQIRCGIKL